MFILTCTTLFGKSPWTHFTTRIICNIYFFLRCIAYGVTIRVNLPNNEHVTYPIRDFVKVQGLAIRFSSTEYKINQTDSKQEGVRKLGLGLGKEKDSCFIYLCQSKIEVYDNRCTILGRDYFIEIRSWFVLLVR